MIEWEMRNELMEKGAPKMNKENSKLFKIFPVETDRNHEDKSGEKSVIQRNWQSDKSGRYFAANLSVTELKLALAKERVKLEKVALKEEGDFIIYRYKDRPLIKLNRKDGQFYSLASEVEQHGKESVQHQAHIVLNVLKLNGLSNAAIGKPVFPSSARHILSQLKTYKQGT